MSFGVVALLLALLANSTASHYNGACKPVSVCELLRIENIGADDGAGDSCAMRHPCPRHSSGLHPAGDGPEPAPPPSLISLPHPSPLTSTSTSLSSGPALS